MTLIFSLRLAMVVTDTHGKIKVKGQLVQKKGWKAETVRQADGRT